MIETYKFLSITMCWLLAIVTFFLHLFGYMPTDDAIATMALLIVTMVGVKE